MFDAVVFDLDGTLVEPTSTINDPMASRGFPLDPQDYYLIPGIKERLNRLQIPFAIASNQTGVQKGLRPIGEAVRAMMFVQEKLVPDCLFAIFAASEDFGVVVENWATASSHRMVLGYGKMNKPNPGMLYYCMEELGQNLLYVGNKDTDCTAAELAGCQYMDVKEFLRLNV